MEASPRNAYDLFSGKSRFLVPDFQRPYVWNEKSQWKPLWDDVVRIASDLLAQPAESQAIHFLGAIVLQHESLLPGDAIPWQVIDGQQRLLTLQLLMLAARDEFEDTATELTRETARLTRLLYCDEEEVDPNDLPTQFKIWPTAGDQQAFRRVMKQERTLKDHDPPLLIAAYQYFRAQIRGWLKADRKETADRGTALSTALRERLMVVAIGLGYGDNPNVIFETLNARGTPLLAWDLVKNEVMYLAKQNEGNEKTIYSDFIQPIEKDSWWREYVRQGTLYEPRIDLFLLHWLTLRTRELVPSDNLYPAIKAYLNSRDHVEVTRDLSLVASHYKALEELDDTTTLGRFAKRWRATDIRVITPHVLWLVLQNAQGDTLQQALSAFESFLVRRIVCRINTPGLNRNLVPLLSQLDQAGVDNADRVVTEFLASLRSGKHLPWPDDDQFRQDFVTRPLYGGITGPRMRMILEALSDQLTEDSDAVIESHQDIYVEHVLPRAWQTNYPLVEYSEEAEERREKLIHTVGNLTLTTAKTNIKMSADRWDVKRRHLGKAGLALNSDLLEHAGGSWSEDEIVARGERLADLALRVWPRPKGRMRLI